jgi:lipid-binding SYLF domain-containing protein
MERRHLIIAAALLPLSACTTTPPGSAATDPAARKRDIDSGVDRALSDLTTQVPGSRELLGRAQGVLVFPRLVSAGLVVGGTGGQGALRKGRATVGYYSMAGASVGFIAGAQSRALFLLFMTPDALAKFENSSGWTAGADASVAFMDAGVNAQVNTKTLQQPVIGYALTNAGLMANLSIDGSKITRMQI